MNLNDFGVLLRNDHGNDKPWIKINLIGTKSNRDAIGAKVKVTTGDLTQFSFKKSATGYLSQNDPRLHFGLNDATVVDRIEVIWPAGGMSILENVQVNQVVTIKEGDDVK